MGMWKECDFRLFPLMRQQTHCCFLTVAICELWFATLYRLFYIDENNTNEMIFNTDLLFPPVSKYFILRGFLPVVMLTASLFSGIYLTFDDITTERVPWVIPIVTRN